MSVRVAGQISPGELTKAHAGLEGMSNCTKCHVLGEQVYNSKCLDCHTEVKSLMNAGRGYHASSEVKGKNCWSCHSEHHGREFQIVRFDEKKFNHEKTGFQLTGTHAKAECSDCHKKEFITDSKLKNRKKTFLGLNQNCLTCHADVHQNTLGNDCQKCHNTNSFKPAELFDHNKSQFKLTGKHISVQCADCHKTETKNGKPFQKFKGISSANCTPCHTDPHQGRFGSDCQKCHNTTDFRQVKTGNFDHSKTKFPLLGKHQKVTCNDCHSGGISSKPKFEYCTDCHNDAHKGQFTSDGILKDCSLCHTVNGYTPSLFTIEQHNVLFKLEGAHLSLPCFSCHKKEDQWVFNPLTKECTSCHENVHGNEISSIYGGGSACQNCHSLQNWKQVSFDHTKTEFPLKGKHSKAGCMDCHTSKNTVNKYRFASLTKDCIQCHEDIHRGQFADKGPGSCESCHGYEQWKPVLFNHNTTRFSLEGAHAKVPCAECHTPVTMNGQTYLQYKLQDFKCAACHK
ncbi:MAG: cytochrome C [Ignavibacteriaceae bacterium]|nr:cytochrome C [Ignavibacteriaceae bacterium]